MGLGGRLALPQLAGIDQLKDHSESRLIDRRQELVARRIEELQTSNKRKAEIAAMTRDELIGILTEIVHATRARLSEARQADGLKAAEMLAMKWGWNEPERVIVQSGEIKVDAAVVEQLRAVYAEVGAARPKLALCALGATTALR
jgi:hypothetical protein